MSGMNAGFAAYLAKKKAGSTQVKQSVTSSVVTPANLTQPGLPNVGKRHAKVAIKVKGVNKHSPTAYMGGK